MGYRILVVDDENTIRKVVERHFVPKGYEIFTANDGREALEKIRQVDPHVVLLDITMPNMDGLEVLQNLRKIHATVPVIVLTAYDDLSEQTRALGAVDYVTKPFEFSYLEERVRMAVALYAPLRLPPLRPDRS
jgi:two-component system, OmpR family, response regulator VicR